MFLKSEVRISVAVAALIGVAALLATPASAQMSVTTIGATDAQACYNDASDRAETSLDNCTEALRRKNLSRRDERATLVNRGIILNRRERYAEAIADFDAALNDDDTLAPAYLNRGNSYFFLGDLNAALGDYDAAIANQLNQLHVAWYNKGLVYLEQKRADDARDAFRRALDIQPDFSAAANQLEKLGVATAD
jgi:tetratricopeptide (TPR) repeat protein